ncbi:hypothetical protein L9F63_005549, partial [Diploptera punctata]
IVMQSAQFTSAAVFDLMFLVWSTPALIYHCRRTVEFFRNGIPLLSSLLHL